MKIDTYLLDGCGRCSLFATPKCKVKNWQEELDMLRNILLDSELTEELKWSVPCYTFQGGNVILLGAFKEYCSIMFIKGALLKDEQGILVQQTENSQATRLVKFTNLQEVMAVSATLKNYITEAIEIEKSGLKVNYKKVSEFAIPEEFQQKLDENSALKTAFYALTPGRQRSYLLHFAGAKQAKTREARVEKYIPKILLGKGFDE